MKICVFVFRHAGRMQCEIPLQKAGFEAHGKVRRPRRCRCRGRWGHRGGARGDNGALPRDTALSRYVLSFPEEYGGAGGAELPALFARSVRGRRFSVTYGVFLLVFGIVDMAVERGAAGARSGARFGAVEAKSAVCRPFCSRKGVFRHEYARKRADLQHAGARAVSVWNIMCI